MQKEIVPAGQHIPNKLFIIPLSGKPIFPGIFTPLMIITREDIEVVEQSMQKDNMLGLIMLKDEDPPTEVTSNDLYSIGTAAKIIKKINLPDGGMNIFISTLKRFRVKHYISEQIPLSADIEFLDDEAEKGNEVKALTRSIISEMKILSENNPLFSEEMRLNMVNIDNPGKIADFVASIINIERGEQQKILETLNVKKRIEQVFIFIKKEQELLRIQKKIQKQLNEKIEKSQREYFLKEELKAIKKELGMPIDSKSSEYLRFKEAIEKLNLHGEAKEQVEQELQKFSLMEPISAEFGVTRNYIDTIISLPWNDPKPEDLNLQKAKVILDKDHYGLEDVKERIIEYLSVRKLKKDTKGSIICLVGPPGVGKTSIGRSIAKAMGKEFFRFSVGGMRDEAEIKGHRRTYIGAMPGKVIQGLKIVKSKNPVFMIDEIDKLGVSFQGDPSSALLEVLDPEQNYAFRDHYLDLPFDISHVLFITTANILDTIPGPLRDRMEIIRLSGYIKEEKIAIAKKYLIPKTLAAAGLTKKDVIYTSDALTKIADQYAREAGVRNYEKALDRIDRKIAKQIVLDGKKPPVTISAKEIETYLGPPQFRPEEIKKITKPGMVIGLAWTNFGGDTLMIESVYSSGKGGFKMTGQMGDVMKESATIAYTYVRTIAPKFKIQKDFFEKNIFHIHIPEGATPKDGPSAGITMATALLSLIRKKMIKKNFAMTGELSLTGSVLPIGGLKEKTIAARRNNIKNIIIPKQNEKDLVEIPAHVKKGIKFYLVDTFDSVIELIF
ncbi:MAG: endopeptidase La [Spirochaetaceae bacterium]|nr:endopeptidase La [Spirochaetaceae bacterium]